MTEDEAITELINDPELCFLGLDSKFHTKEFIIKAISEHGVYFSCDDISAACVKIDYDIDLAREIYNFNGKRWISNNVLRWSYGPHITSEEINKLKTTLELLTS